jgi:hypothetical protein
MKQSFFCDVGCDFLQAESGGNGLVTRRMGGQGGADEFSMKIPNNKVGRSYETAFFFWLCVEFSLGSNVFFSFFFGWDGLFPGF